MDLWIKTVLIMTLIVLAIINDLQNYKVRNEITLTFAIIGIVYNISFYGIHNFYTTVLGLIVPFLILLPLYAARMLGAGDIKLYCSIGAFIGLKLILMSIAYSFFAGAIIALVIMIIRKNAFLRFKYFFTYIKCCLLCMKVMPYADLTEKQDGTKMHFTIPIAIGTIYIVINNLHL
ncbi:MAG: A24 family peptidase [Lutisporaceae bacterium]